jgi:glycerol-3-phosphate dehydrogenase
LSADRSACLGLTEKPLDILVVGGGIVGSSIARDAAMRGLRTGLVEQRDFAFGTSSRSSRLLHGGLRYLAQGRVGLVREASVEKSVLHRIAPHLAEPLAFIFPTYRGTDWPRWKLSVGVKVYDLLCGGKNLGRSSLMSKEKLLRAIPEIDATNLTGAVRYFDGFTNDARLVIDTLRSAHRQGALVLNYARFGNASRANDGWECQVEDQIDGKLHKVLARVVVNATGPWADGLPHSQVQLRLTKGIHLVVNRARLPVTDAVVLTEGKRILFVIPWGERLILGTTDTDYNGPLDKIVADSNDVAYVLSVVNQFFPRAKLGQGDIISTWAGVRPLLADPRGKASDISRAHEIRNPEPGWWDVAGGKLTTCRLMAEQTLDRITARMNFPATKCRTALELLLDTSETAGGSGILPPSWGRGPIEHACLREWAVNLDDVMIRRTGWHHYYADRREKAVTVADWMGEILNWNTEERARQLEQYLLLL